MRKGSDCQQGRSMFELLGALAIMGVLSVGSIAGYRLANDWHRANEITHGIRERAVIIQQQRDLDAELSLKEFHPDTETDSLLGHEVTLDVYSNEASGLSDVDAMTVHDVSMGVCQRIANRTDWDELILLINNVEIDLDDTTGNRALCHEADDNVLTFALENVDAGTGGEEPPPPVVTNRDCGVKDSVFYKHNDNYHTCGVCNNGLFGKREDYVAPECVKCDGGTDYKEEPKGEGASCGDNKECRSGSCVCKAGYSDDGSGGCRCVMQTVVHRDLNGYGCCMESAEEYCPGTDPVPTARTCTPSCVGTCNASDECVCSGDLVLNNPKTACVCPTGKVLKTGTTDTCVECNNNTDCTDASKPACNASGVCEGLTCTGDLEPSGGSCVCPTGKVLKTGTTDTCVECNGNSDCTDASKPVCNITNSTCIAGTKEGQPCTSYNTNECGLGYYCQFRPRGSGCPSCNCLGEGVCKPVGSGTSLKDGKYLSSPSAMDWWSAYSWCIGNGKNLVTNPIAGHSLTLTEVPNGDTHTYAAVGPNGDIYRYFGQDMTVWTGVTLNNYNNDDPCYARVVEVGSVLGSRREYVTYELRYESRSFYPLCE